MMTYATHLLVVLTAIAAPVTAQDDPSLQGVVAHAEVRSPFVQIGHPVLVTFSIENTLDDAVAIAVPGVEPEIPSPEMGLPLSHVFSGEAGTSNAVTVTTEAGRAWDLPIKYRSQSKAPIVSIAPHSIVGTTLDLRDFFPCLRSPGVYRLNWQPYGGMFSSNTVVIEIAPLKQAEILLDAGKLTVRFFYEDAPGHVANFISLAESRFYDNLTFHRLEPGYALIGGCPRGDGAGIRNDGKRIAPEFNSKPFVKGTVAMALLEGDINSASCQFFICNTRQRDWDGRYTVFGELVGEESFETLSRLMEIPVDAYGAPVEPIQMRSVRIVNAPVDSLPIAP